ncbi:hypothetical protein EJB05_57723, partial [Eragrostis curvula]
MQGKVPLQFLKDIDNFSTAQEHGRGGFSVGTLPYGKVIAVKRLQAMTGTQEEQFEAELNVLMKLQHKNIVKLLGYCDEKQEHVREGAGSKEKLLCYEYLPNGNLGKMLSESGDLDWNSRFRIIKGICSGLHYLHEEWDSNPVIHFDFKPSNILLDSKLISVFQGYLVKNKPKFCINKVTGSIGDIAPEYYRTGEISVKSDIFSLGTQKLGTHISNCIKVSIS